MTKPVFYSLTHLWKGNVKREMKNRNDIRKCNVKNLVNVWRFIWKENRVDRLFLSDILNQVIYWNKWKTFSGLHSVTIHSKEVFIYNKSLRWLQILYKAISNLMLSDQQTAAREGELKFFMLKWRMGRVPRLRNHKIWIKMMESEDQVPVFSQGNFN